jgi:hypothetical protein
VSLNPDIWACFWDCRDVFMINILYCCYVEQNTWFGCDGFDGLGARKKV